MNFTINNAAAKFLLQAVLALVLSALLLFGSTWVTGQPLYINGLAFGLNAKAFEELQAKLDATQKSCTLQLSEATQRNSAQQKELEQWRLRYKQELTQAQAAWFHVGDAQFEFPTKKTWRHPDSELTLGFESANAYSGELVLKTNAPEPGNRIRFGRNENSVWVIPMGKWKYRVTLREIDHSNDGATVRVERQSL